MRRVALILVTILGVLAAYEHALSAPALTCSPQPAEGSVPLAVRFECVPATPLTWRFGDGQQAAGASPSHTYTRFGRFHVQAVGKSGAWSGEVNARVQKTVTVAGGGGGAEIVFEGRRGQAIRIRMRAGTAGMEPYGHLESKSGAEYRPPTDAVQSGTNTWQGALSDDGRHVLTVFDGANAGGTVEVVIEEP